VAKPDEVKSEENIPLPPLPQSLYQFQNSWRIVKKSKDMQYLYLKQIPCSDYVKVFDEFLEQDFVSDFLVILRDYFIRDNVDIYLPLKSLANAKRFQIVSLFLSDQDKKVLEGLFSQLKRLDCYSMDEIRHLGNLYQVKI